jgi:CHASE2 domain-containing sensor protein/serine phosphatase RsbU (regulator of sigma subunit)
VSEAERRSPPASDAPAWSEHRLVRLVAYGQSRPLGVTVLVLLLLLAALQPDGRTLSGLRLAMFDTYQRSFPRKPVSAPALIVTVDEASLKRYGQWPWPRTLLARLLEAVGRGHPAAIGIDLLLPEPDRLSPDQLAPALPGASPVLRSELSKLPSSDAVLAHTISTLPVVVGMAGLEDGGVHDVLPRSVPFLVKGGDAGAYVRAFPGLLRSLEAIDAAAVGHGLLSVDAPDGVVRRVLLVSSVDGVLTPALSIDMLRVAAGASDYKLDMDSSGVQAIRFGETSVPLDRHGGLWVHFSRSSPGRFVSAADVLDGHVDAAQFERKLVLIGFTGLGLIDFQATPLGERMAGTEVHAQILENIFDGHPLRRPAWAAQVERVVLVACGALLIVLVPGLRPRASAVLYALMMGVLIGVGSLLFRTHGLVLDAALPALGATLVYGALLAGTLADTDLQRRQLTRALQTERERAARLAGELEAARQIQVGILPPASADFIRDARFSLHAVMEPAREVGGDLYDFFKLDNDRLFFLIGDVSGKGLPASMFMAMTKALYKSMALRAAADGAGSAPGELMRIVDRELSRDNPGMLFVTVFAAVLDLRNGHLAYSNAGHDVPVLLLPERGAPARLEGAAGPPLCAVDGFAYASASYDLRAGETLVLVTDGVPEAMDANGALYGRERLAALLASLSSTGDAGAIANALHDNVRAFAGNAERSDDLTVMVVRWNGPA